MKRLLSLLSSVIVMLGFHPVKADEFDKNEQVRAVLRQNGDDGRTPRSIQHFAYFITAGERDTFRDLVVERGYAVDDAHAEGSEPRNWAIAVSKIQAPVDLDDKTGTLEIEAKRLQGQYDGWETDVMRQR